MTNTESIKAKIEKCWALYQGGATEGERLAAWEAMTRYANKLKEASRK